ncbi:DUF2852 domain-containing protein [Aliigemmobacter aestuarii]|uniref:DUF2852 domain-containing protein n=1 Tax=Aliigemmobacter aestuarii TaxID=1445661 RepID=A0A4S3MPF6_9RHOB|nr:DUF2852 domain-containing protein [Gemmobacter aestuarii]THD84269.1 DUF2852 domain-containing protein [Gemmobacter aestuarii]
MHIQTAQPATGRIGQWFRNAESWLDARGRVAWIAAMVLGFIFVWPVGLMLLAYMIYAGKFACSATHRKESAMFCSRKHDTRHSRAWNSSGNSAFDAYKAETLKRLEDEQEAFEAFLARLREAKDKQEFDRFMEDRARAASHPVDAREDVSPSVADAPPRPGSY